MILEGPARFERNSMLETWADQDIGIIRNVSEPMYVSLANTAGPPAVVYHDDPDAVALGFGGKSNPQPGGSGRMYFDDIRLYGPDSARGDWGMTTSLR